ncbi:hypothetical protein BDP81DRAFT_137017 [Colletotrichum phormii]|uniref:Uncharacterized protein n=1 Tax=Colletotrichum phormii TaxID=359342 RepID=A0AAI9ZEU9_9PEZI|nr:uncharacterized protein BDP81DRAFT_137017 [Colletotrichum phormii]KAK1623258.1 hypothetical protein BDP81DRAFT_137017 [Colletotrichum phormii]
MGNDGNAPQPQWRTPGTNGSGFPPPPPTAQSWTDHYTNTDKTWNSAGTFSLFKTLRNGKNGAPTSSRRSRVWPASSREWFKPENGGTVIFAGHVVLIIFEVIAIVISSQGLERVKKFPGLVLRAEFAW